ncbi:MAG: MBL fold metallo-hydrolase, partial [Oscillospiraceae bacterium]|nr:MBL fold metallo-hydrolase [Oscillospiraceae bacterium]
MRKKTVIWILSLLLLTGILCSLVSLSFATPSIKTDSDFFGKLNLDLAGMEAVKTAVNAGNYSTAKTALLSYYKSKFAGFETYTGGMGGHFGSMAMLDTFAYLETPLASATVTYQDSSFRQYSFGKVSNTSGCYVLSVLKKTSYSVELCSGEYATASMRPVLNCYNSSGTLLASVEPTADATVKYGNKSTNYATATTMFARHDATSSLPYSTNSQRAYLKFTVPSGTSKTELVIYARINEGSSSSHSLDLWQFSARGTDWTETNLTWDWLVNNNAIGHYSYDGVTGGFDWRDEIGTPPNDWIDMHCRLHSVYGLFSMALDTGTSSADKEKYLNKGKSLLFDFINDADVTVGWPDGRDKETPFRLNYAPFFYKTLLENNKLSADENVTFLKWIYDEVSFLNGGGNLFDNSGSNHKSSAYTNHSLHHIAGFYTGLAYFPEFKSASTWRSTYESRWTALINDIGLLGTDGSYNEGLLGAYTQESMSSVSHIAMAMKETGDTTSAKSRGYTGYMIRFMGFMMDMTFPNNSTPATGQRAATAPKSYIQDFLNCLSPEFYSEQGVQELVYFLDHSQGLEPNTTAYYPIGQFATDRTGYNTSDSMLYISARAAGHYDHPDALAILYYSGGRYLLAETSISTNTTAGHNTIECNGKTQRMNLKPMTYKDLSGLDAVGNRSMSYMSGWTEITEGFRHERALSYFKALDGLIVVTDKAQYGNGSSSTQYSYVQNWHTASGSNATVASDSYDTGKTAFSSGTNLIIAQASSNNITATVSGNNFKYTQKQSGVVTYQTVLYPAQAGATVSIQPKKMSLNVGDSVARAVQIAVSDTANPELKTLYYYQSLESTPSSRAFGSYTTNGANGAVALNGSSKRIFASITAGSELTVTSSSLPVLKTSTKVTDLAASLQGTTLVLESSDEKINSCSIRVNLDGATVSKVALNGEEQPFYTDEQGTVYVGQQIIHFYGDAMGTLSKWAVNHATLTADTANSVITGVTTGGDPYFYYNGGDMSYDIRSGDIVEIRLKTTLGTSTAPTTQIFYETTDGSGFGANGAVNGTRPGGYQDGEFTIVRFALPAKSVGKTIKKLRIDPFPGYEGKSFSLDYIYVGSTDKAPSTYDSCLFFDFEANAEAERRYTAQSYGDRNFDTNSYSTSALATGGVWYLNGNQSSGIAVSGGTMAVTQKTTSDNWGYLSTANCLRYYTNSGDVIQVRLKVLNMEVTPGTSPKLQFYASNSTADLYNTTPVTIPFPGTVAEGQYYVLQAPLNSPMVSADYLTCARLQWTNLRNLEGKSGKVVIDYIYIGPASKTPGSKSSYQIKYNDGFNLFAALDTDLGTAIVNGGDKTSTYSVSGRKLTMQNKRASGETYHYFNQSGDEFTLKAGTAYRFSCTTSGVWGSQVEAFLRTGSTHIRIDSNNFTFTPTITGSYQLRFDVNVAGQTHSFENVRIEEAANTLITYGLTPTSTHYFGEAQALSVNGFSRPGYIFKGWSTTKGATTATYTDGQSVGDVVNVPGSTVTLYAVWEKNSSPSTWMYQLPCRTLDGSSYRQHMSYVIKTRGGKIIVIDGGYETENGDAEYLLSFLQEITGKAVPNVDAWFFTHPHEDHLGAFEGLAKRHAGEITVDTIYYNFPSSEQISKYAPTSTGNAVANVINIFEGLVKNLKRVDGTAVKTVEILARHENKCKGSFTIDTVSIDVLMTCEDMFAAADSNTTLYTGTLETNGKAYTNKTLKELLYDDFGNNISCVIRMTVGGKNVLFLGDLAEPGGLVLKSYHDTNATSGSKYFSLKSDMVQMAHHGQTGVPKSVYTAIAPDVCLWPAPDWVYTAGSTSTLS